MLKSGVDDATFKTFITDNVASLAEIPSYYSLYGIANRGDRRQCYIAMSKGKPLIKKPSYDSNFQIDGELLDFAKGEMVQQMSCNSNYGSGGPYYKSLPSSDEIKNIVDLATLSNLSLPKFELEVMKAVARHIKAAGERDFIKNEIDIGEKQHYFVVDRFPAIRRVQLLQLYFTWLKDDLKVMTQDASFSRWLGRVEDLAQPVRLDNVPEDLTWTCLHESRIRQRNTECARLLSQMASHKFIDEYLAWKNARVELRRLIEWKIEYAGCNAYNPYDSRWMKDHSLVFPSINENVKKDHPLYVLRRENGKLVLKRALIPYKNNTIWAVQAGMTKEFVPGDPLFQVSENGKYIDAEETIRGIFKGMPENTAKQFAAKIPLFKIEVK